MHFDYDTVWVDGPPSSGKTTLIERLLTSATSYDLAVARVRQRARPGKIGARRRRTAPDTDRDRFTAAGASATDVLRAVPDRTFGDLDEIHSFQDEHRGAANAVLFEGAPVTRPLRGELSVYVIRPLKDSAALVSFGEKEIARLDLQTYLSWMAGKNPGAHEEHTDDISPHIDESEWTVMRVKDIEIPADIRRKLKEWAKSGVPVIGKRWVALPDHDGVVYGDVYVINVHHESERPVAERLAAEIRKIRGDGRILRSFDSAPHESRRISVFIANLNDRRDAELKKVIARIKRGLPRASQEEDDDIG